MTDPAVIARLCERIGDVLRDAPDHDAGRQALVAVLARWVAIAALQAGDPDHGTAYAVAVAELHVGALAAFERMGAGWRTRN